MVETVNEQRAWLWGFLAGDGGITKNAACAFNTRTWLAFLALKAFRDEYGVEPRAHLNLRLEEPKKA